MRDSLSTSKQDLEVIKGQRQSYNATGPIDPPKKTAIDPDKISDKVFLNL